MLGLNAFIQLARNIGDDHNMRYAIDMYSFTSLIWKLTGHAAPRSAVATLSIGY
ncbi:hypothetical protein [Sphingobium sp. HWE2-09]|uniref:hypothetical protein n=1 Tax=Sphingobium sp. HWE2-09 TaxID=3108390 RepID=UPI002DCE1CA7|nr:hypothetical protein [Sphingobium sp. HWE2-09]